METIRTFLKPVIDLKGTGAQIKRLRKISGYILSESPSSCCEGG